MYKLFSLVLVLMIVSVHAETVKPRVFVSIPTQKQFIEKIAGDSVEVKVFLPPGESPETFSPSPKLIVSLSRATSYFQIGVPFEETWTQSIRTVNPDIRIVHCCDQIIGPEIDGTVDHDHDMHIWTNPIWVEKLSEIIKDELIHINPSHESIYIENFREFKSSLKQLDIAINNRLSDRKTDYFIVSHAAWGEFAKHYGLVQLALEKNNREIGPRSLLEIVRIARREEINTVFILQQYRTPLIDNLAQELNARVVIMDPLAEDYMGNMIIVADTLAKSLIAQ